jgi:hypothetical protein
MAVAEKVRSFSDIKNANKVSAEVITVTPKMAEEMLGKNVKNRKVSKGLVNAYARDMGAADWKMTGEAIKFDTFGHLIDGQHRLLACIEAKRPFDTIVMRGLEPDVQDVMDSGRGRQSWDVLAIHGYTHALRTAAATRNLVFIKNGACTFKVSSAEVLRTFARHKQINDSSVMAAQAFGISQSLVAAIHYIGSHFLNKSDVAENFLNVFVTGNSRDGCPAHAWRERLIKTKASKTTVSRSAMFYGSIHVWNLFVAGESVSHIKVPDHAKITGLKADKI